MPEGCMLISVRLWNSKDGGSTAIPYRESTGFLQGFPCVVIPPLHVLAFSLLGRESYIANPKRLNL